MRLITEQMARELPAIGSTESVPLEDKFVRALFYSAISPAKWLIFEYGADENIVFCYADLYGEGRQGGAELGYTSVAELESLELPLFGLPIVLRDEYFVPMPFLECIDSDGRIIA